jgi:predicted esterase
LHIARGVRSLISTVLVVAASCSSASAPPPPVSETDAGPIPTQPDAPQVSTPDAGPTYRYLCDRPPPANAPVPVSPPMPAAGCPVLQSGSNTITSSGHSREFLLVVPANLAPTETPPVLFMWHWLGGSANSFLTKGSVQAAADDQRFIAVLPIAKGAMIIGTSFNTRWPFDISQPQSRMNEEFTFFDDMLACVQNQYDINEQCVSTVGVSAGALFTDPLAQARSNTLASFVSLSGGTNATLIKPWSSAARKLPGVVLWGGDGPPAMDGNKDILGCAGIGMDFSVASKALESKLTVDGHFFVECKHNCGHVEPPLDPLPGESKYSGMWAFALNHPFWLAEGDSPFLETGLPANMPPWCGIGSDSAVPRTGGGCPEAENPCQH